MSLIDHIWSNFTNNYINSAGILLDDTTDHSTIFMTLCGDLINTDSSKEIIDVKFRLITDDNHSRFVDRISAVDWNYLSSFMNINEAALMFVRRVNDIYYRSFPLKVKKIRKNRFAEPWLTADILKLVKYKSARVKNFKLGYISEEDYRKSRNRVNNLIQKAKLKYYRGLFHNNTNDLKKTWKSIKNLTTCNVTNNSLTSVTYEGMSITNLYDIGQCFRIILVRWLKLLIMSCQFP